MDFSGIFLLSKTWSIKRILFFVLSFSTIALYSQNHTISFNKKNNGIRVVQNDKDQMLMNVNFDGIDAIGVQSSKGSFRQLDLPGCYRTGEPGNPQLPSMRKLIEVPFGAECKIEATDFEVQEYNLADLGIRDKVLPFQPSYSKSIDPSQVEFKINNQTYSKDEYNKLDLVTIERVGRLRGVELAKITINPVRYNPVKNSILIYNNIQLKVTYKHGNQTLTKNIAAKTNSPYFDALYSTIINHTSDTKDSYTNNPDHTKYPIKYLIVTAPEFESELSDFVAWKTLKGFYVNMVTTSEIGSTASDIKTWVQQQYDAATETDPAPTFLLLVGDVAQVPASATGTSSDKATDLYYCTMDGSSDIIPDIYYGRISAQNTTQLRNQINKILYYEKYEFSNPSYLNKTTLIAGADGTWNPKVAQPTINYGTTNYFNAEHGFTSVNAYLNSYSGCYDADKIKVSFINYTAHCSETSWGDPNLTQSMVNNFTNSDQYPLAIGNCCLAADYGTNECIGETWMRKANGGSVAYIGSSPSSYWYEDFYWSVGAHSLIEYQYPTFEGSTIGAYDAPFVSDYICVDALVFVGDLAVNEAHDQGYPSQISTRYYWEAYNCLSDPSIFIYFTEGNNNTVNHASGFPIGSSTFNVSASPNSLVAISKDGILLGTAFVPESGSVTVNVTPINSTGNVDIVVTKSQFKPYITTIPAEVQSGPYLSLISFTIADSSGNGMVEINEPFNIHLTIKNVGSETAQSITASVSTTNPAISKSSDNLNIALGDVGASSEMIVDNHFDFTASNSVADQTIVNFNVILTDNSAGKKTYNFNRSIVINAPKLMLGDDLYISDVDANNNGILDPGETGLFRISLTNTGHSATKGAGKLSLSTPSSYLTIIGEIDSVGLINPEQSVWLEFDVHAASETPNGTEVHLMANAFSYDSLYVDENSYSLTIGQIPELQIGNGSTLVSDYPFNNYYENNKTQLLFLASELGSGTKVIKDLAFDLGYFTHDPTDRDLHNFMVRMMATNKTSLSQFEDLSSCQPVFDTSVYLLNAALGWQTINFQHGFAHNGIDNVIIELVWGDNGEYALYSDRAKVNASATSNISVAYGFADSQTPPLLSGTSVNRPNILMHFESSYNLTFVVLNENNQPVTNALVKVEGQQQATNANGLSKFVFAESRNDLGFTIDAYGYQFYVDTLSLISNNQFDTVRLHLISRHELTFNVFVNGTPVEGANIMVGNATINTGADGIVRFSDLIEGYTYQYVVNYDGFIGQSNNVSIFSDSSININLLEDIRTPVITSVSNLKNGKAKMQWSLAKLSANKPAINSKQLFGYTVFLDGQEIESGITANEYLFSNLSSDHVYLAGVQANYSTGNSTLVEREFTYNQIYIIDFHITANGSSLQDAIVNFDGVQKLSDANGLASFEISNNGLKDFVLSKTGYYTKFGAVQVTKDTSVFIEMNAVPDVKFIIHDENNIALSGAIIDLKGLEGLTGADGNYVFENVAAENGLIYSVRKDGFLNVVDTFDLQNNDTTIAKTLYELPEITFIVKDTDNQPLPDAMVEFNNDVILTNTDGLALFSDVLPGEGYAFKISKSAFIDQLDTVDIKLENKTIVVNLKSKPDVEFIVSCDDRKLAGCTVTFGGISINTNNDGTARFENVAKGIYTYTVNNTGYFSLSNTIEVDDTDMVTNVNLQAIPDVTFTIESNGQPVENAKVTIGTNVKYTNISGQVVFCDIVPGKYNYAVELNGYYATTDSVEVSNSDVEKVINIKQIPDVRLTVTDGTNIIEGAKVELNRIVKFTGTDGQVIFTDLSAGNYEYKITKDLYANFNGNIKVGEVDVDETVVVNLKTYLLYFTVTDGQNPVSDAKITIGSQVFLSDNNGSVVFDNILPASNIQYSVKKEGYYEKQGFIYIESNDVNVTVELVLITYKVDFEITDINGKLSGAEVVFNGEQKYALSDGLVEFSHVIPNWGLTYKVSKPATHNSIEGSIDLKSDTIIRVNLLTIAFFDRQFADYSVYPNPAIHSISINIPNALAGFRYEITDQTGREVLQGNTQATSDEIDLKKLSKGVYFIRLIIDSKSVTEKIIVE